MGLVLPKQKEAPQSSLLIFSLTHCPIQTSKPLEDTPNFSLSLVVLAIAQGLMHSRQVLYP